MANFPCELVLIDCLPCNDDPIRNITAEAPDVDVFIGFADFRGNPPFGVLYAQIGCKRICFSTESQRDADDCAIRQAKECVYGTWRPPKNPPIPPGPNGNPGGGNPTTPGAIPPSNPRNNRLPTFRNRAIDCTAFCPDGTPFVETIPAGIIVALTQIGADEMAASLCRKRAEVDKLCITSDLLPGVCLGTSYSFTFAAIGGLPFSDGSYIWNTFGDLPPGLELNGSSGRLSGTPSAIGEFLFQIEVSDANGNSATKLFTICVMDIVTDAILPNATEGDSYTQPLLEEPAQVSSEQWALVSGKLPLGLALNAAGSITGTPEEITDGERDFTFTVQCVATCGSGQLTCQKQFTLTVDPAVDCMGTPNAVQDIGTWTQISPPAAGTFTMFDGDGTLVGVDPVNPFGEVRCQLCNSHIDPYDITVEFNWTVGGFVAFISTQAIFRLNGVDHASPVFAANGTYNFSVTLPLPSGINTLNLYCTANGLFAGTLNATVTVRPLAPP